MAGFKPRSITIAPGNEAWGYDARVTWNLVKLQDMKSGQKSAPAGRSKWHPSKAAGEFGD